MVGSDDHGENDDEWVMVNDVDSSNDVNNDSTDNYDSNMIYEYSMHSKWLTCIDATPSLSESNWDAV